MKIILESLKLKKGNPFVQENDIHVHFEYERLKEQKMKFYLNVYVGKDEYDYRFQMNLIYIIAVYGQVENDDTVLIEEAIKKMLPSLTELICILDSLIQEERH